MGYFLRIDTAFSVFFPTFKSSYDVVVHTKVDCIWQSAVILQARLRSPWGKNAEGNRAEGICHGGLGGLLWRTSRLM
jgi:hypothetical protein